MAPTFLVPRFGVYNIMIPCVVICGCLVFWVLSLKTVVSTIVFAVLYGFFTGTCTFTFPLFPLVDPDFFSIDAGLFAPMVASLAKKDTEMGARLGICFGFTGLVVSFLVIFV